MPIVTGYKCFLQNEHRIEQQNNLYSYKRVFVSQPSTKNQSLVRTICAKTSYILTIELVLQLKDSNAVRSGDLLGQI